MSNLMTRTLTGAWIVLFAMGGFWLHPVTFLVAGLVMMIGTQVEYYRMMRITGVRPQVVTGIITGITVFLISSLVAANIISRNWFLLLIPMLAVVMVIELYRNVEKPFDSLAHTYFSILYTVIPFSMMPFSAFYREGLPSLINQSLITFSPGIVIGFFILLWTNDTAAYLVGITLGKHRLFERISPKKSWEGFIGGIVVTAAMAYLISGWLGVVEKSGWVIIGVIISVTGTYGDLIESMLKRSIGVKDSGSIMPGHGGFLDRFDSVVISFPMVYLFIAVFG
ncbi:MAG: phosphatidate cytidylyltransferase [Bacteroidales bacterium]|nr:phosphatidate cytidylyltransferase [Bacteroidales bacterium]